MGFEIERKFLVAETLMPQLGDGESMHQGYVAVSRLDGME